jgi:hypothetical protein
MRPMIRTDIHAINAIDAEQLAADREWDHTDLTYLQALTELAGSVRRRVCPRNGVTGSDAPGVSRGKDQS